MIQCCLRICRLSIILQNLQDLVKIFVKNTLSIGDLLLSLNLSTLQRFAECIGCFHFFCPSVIYCCLQFFYLVQNRVDFDTKFPHSSSLQFMFFIDSSKLISSSLQRKFCSMKDLHLCYCPIIHYWKLSDCQVCHCVNCNLQHCQ